MMRRSVTALAAAIILGLGLSVELSAQSALSIRGLGYTIEPIDARARGLGGVSLGLPEPEISWTNPASALGIGEPGIIIGYQYDNFSTEAPGGTADGSTARFPLLLAAFPFGSRLVVMAGYGAFLDQNWRIERPDSLFLGADTIPVTDLVSSEGGVSRLRAAAAYEIFEGFGVGLGVDAYTGDVIRTQGRLFLEEGQTVPSCCRASWNYSGMGVTGGLRYIPSEALSLGASVSYGGTLDAEVIAGESPAASFDLPIVARGGASGRIGQATLLALGGSWSGWSSLDEALASDGGARDAWSVEGGVEYEGVSLLDRPLPLRLGARTAALPFRWGATGESWANERAITLGAGVVLAGGATRSDLSLEIGGRGGEEGGLDESFWRLGFSVRVLGR